MLKKWLLTVLIGLFAVSAYAENDTTVITPYGLAQYRFRDRIINQTYTGGAATRSDNVYANQLGYYVGVKARVNKQLSLQFQIGNDWVNTETVTYLSNNHTLGPNPNGLALRSSLYPYFHLAYAKWDQGMFNLTVGIIPEVSYGALDFIERSLAVGTYGSSIGYGAGQISWAVGTNNSITGAKLGVPLLTSSVKVSAELTAAVVDSAAHAAVLETDPKSYPSMQLYVLDIPVTYKKLTAGLQIATVLFREYNVVSEKGDHEISVGANASYKISPDWSVRATTGFATFGNTNSQPVDTLQFKRVAMQICGGTTIKAGVGTLIVDASYSTDENTKTAASSYYGFWFLDAKYAYSANKNFDITPRLRIFSTQYPDNAVVNAAKTDMKTEIRPEILFTGKF
jgi:hypothetical protein